MPSFSDKRPEEFQELSTTISSGIGSPMGSNDSGPGTVPGARAIPGVGDLRFSMLAVAALLLGLIGLIFPPAGFIAVIAGMYAVNRIDDVVNRLRGRATAMAGIGFGALGVLIGSGLVLLGIGLPMMHTAGTYSDQRKSATNLRHIHQQMIMYAQSNKNWFPGLTPTGVVDSWGAVSNRYGSLGRLVAEDFADAGDLVSPGEIDPTINGQAVRGISTSLGSYAVLEYVGTPGKVLSEITPLAYPEWRESLRSTAIILSDRQLMTDSRYPRSIWATQADQWRGCVVFNDNHVEFKVTDKGHDGLYSSARNCYVPPRTIGNLFEKRNSMEDFKYWQLYDDVGRMISD